MSGDSIMAFCPPKMVNKSKPGNRNPGSWVIQHCFSRKSPRCSTYSYGGVVGGPPGAGSILGPVPSLISLAKFPLQLLGVRAHRDTVWSGIAAGRSKDGQIGQVVGK